LAICKLSHLQNTAVANKDFPTFLAFANLGVCKILTSDTVAWCGHVIQSSAAAAAAAWLRAGDLVVPNKCVLLLPARPSQPQHIIPLVQRFNHQKWERFNSEKVGGHCVFRCGGGGGGVTVVVESAG
jgi:hypothetical protein